MSNRIVFDEAANGRVLGLVGSLKNVIVADGDRLETLWGPIQPVGQVWPLADRLVQAWDQRIGGLEQWYRDLAANIGTMQDGISAAGEQQRGAEQDATYRARGWVG